MKNSKYILGLFVLVLVYAMVGTAAAPPLKFTFKDVKAKGATETDTYGVNASNTITGDYLDSSSVMHGMILKGTKLTTIDDKNGSGTAGFGINSAGLVVGWYTNSSGTITGFGYNKGKFSDIAPKGALETEATGVNDKGDVVGLYIDSAGAQHGFLLHAKKYTKFDAPKAYNTTAGWGIDNKGEITLYAFDSGGLYHSFLKTGTKFKELIAESGQQTIVHTPNNKGDIVGTVFDTTGAHGFLLHKGAYSIFDDPSANNSTRGDGLSDNLLIVGRYTPSAGGNFGFEATAK